MHRGTQPLLLLNAWDAGSARLFEQRGAPAVGTTSAGLAFALGKPDGAVSRDEMLEATARIAGAVDVPVTADIEAGFGLTPDDVGETIRLVLGAGAVGVNLEDAAPGADGQLIAVPEQVERIRAARAAADDEGVTLFINARSDVYWLKLGAPEQRFDLAAERLRAYVAAGADGVFAPGLTDREEIARLVQAVPAPLNLLAAAALPPVAELANLGVARVSSGSGPSRAALGLAGRIADEFLGGSGYAAMVDGALPYDDAQAAFAQPPPSE